MDENPRIAEIRKKLEKDPASRLFAQLAEELRKEGRFDDAIAVSRKGLEKHANYPSARLTFARALLDSGRPADARPELETVVKASPDNIMASRLLGDACEDLGELTRALQQFEQTLRLSPGDKAILEKIDELKKKLASPAPVVVAAAPPAIEVPADFPSVDDAPVDAPAVDSPEGPQTLPILSKPPVVEVASQALDRDLSSGTLSPGSLSVSEIMHFDAANAPAQPAELPAVDVADSPSVAAEASPSVDAPPAALPSVFAAEDEPVVEQTIAFGQVQKDYEETEAQTIAFASAEEVARTQEAPEPQAEPAFTAPTHDPESPAEVAWSEGADVGAQTLPLTSMTLADLYLQQGLKAEASAVLSQVLKDEPENKQAAARLAEVSEESSAAPAPPAEHFEEAAPLVTAWPTAPLPSLPASAMPAALRAQAATTELAKDAASFTPPTPRTKAQIKEESIQSLKAFLGAVEREALEQRATERSF